MRDDSDRFRFAHSSLQEYFLACYLRRALLQSEFGNWALKGGSRETLDFLGQSTARAALAAKLGQGWRRSRDTYRPQASELAFRYALLAHAKGYPAPPAAGFQLPGADLLGLEVDHAGPGLLDLSGLNLKGARWPIHSGGDAVFPAPIFLAPMRRAREWQDCDLSEARMEAGGRLEAEPIPAVRVGEDRVCGCPHLSHEVVAHAPEPAATERRPPSAEKPAGFKCRSATHAKCPAAPGRPTAAACCPHLGIRL